MSKSAKSRPAAWKRAAANRVPFVATLFAVLWLMVGPSFLSPSDFERSGSLLVLLALFLFGLHRVLLGEQDEYLRKLIEDVTKKEIFVAVELRTMKLLALRDANYANALKSNPPDKVHKALEHADAILDRFDEENRLFFKYQWLGELGAARIGTFVWGYRNPFADAICEKVATC